MSDLIQWGPGLYTGIAIIDEDHKKLVDMLNKLNAAMKEGKGKEILASLLHDLVQYTVKHFGHEEQLMTQHKYADSVRHIAEHKKLVAEVVAFKEKLESGTAMISIDLLKFLRDWLGTHILLSDKKLGDALAADGVK